MVSGVNLPIVNPLASAHIPAMQLRSLFCAVLLAGSTVEFCHAADPVPAPAPSPAPAIPVLKYRSVDVKEFEALRKKPNTVVLDVRTPDEFAKGHIEGATNIDVMAGDFKARTSYLDKSKTYLVNCAAGVRSARACKQLGEMDFPSLVNLKGGYAAWVKEAAASDSKKDAK